mmetsp:Transcript_30823/g.77373  ORF Transcript_30823/g.77373 Transcript_30823/m.77373 type:complete len:259 (+) Transcript_30823:46-822(+)|eukprot:CAMPEP_0177654408 /NCGR_PEP_ID=MMETSP0447-20121125/14311_1 /TAXON_ID=0 /ORGANISM="Stygamoeba regulata, Strain BSH-02190019" /LENGTH=258 /DNA_ID=CAMNT_0019158045 /DNA_START=45 /DNA_END=821 /DNA_ORIENTATION=-
MSHPKTFLDQAPERTVTRKTKVSKEDKKRADEVYSRLTDPNRFHGRYRALAAERGLVDGKPTSPSGSATTTPTRSTSRGSVNSPASRTPTKGTPTKGTPTKGTPGRTAREVVEENKALKEKAAKFVNAYKALKVKYVALEETNKELEVKVETMSKEQELFEAENTKLAKEVESLRAQVQKLSQQASDSSLKSQQEKESRVARAEALLGSKPESVPAAVVNSSSSSVPTPAEDADLEAAIENQIQAAMNQAREGEIEEF